MPQHGCGGDGARGFRGWPRGNLNLNHSYLQPVLSHRARGKGDGRSRGAESQREAEGLRRGLRREACDGVGESVRTGIARDFEPEARDDVARGIRAVPGSPAGMRRNRVTTIRPESGSTREVAGGPRTRAASATPGSAWWCGGGACPPACYLSGQGPWERGAVLISAWERPPRRIEWPRNRGASIFDYTVIEVSSLTITSRRRPMALKAASIRSSRERCCTSSTRSTCGRCQPRRRASSALPMPCSLMPR